MSSFILTALNTINKHNFKINEQKQIKNESILDWFEKRRVQNRLMLKIHIGN